MPVLLEEALPDIAAKWMKVVAKVQAKQLAWRMQHRP